MVLGVVSLSLGILCTRSGLAEFGVISVSNVYMVLVYCYFISAEAIYASVDLYITYNFMCDLAEARVGLVLLQVANVSFDLNSSVLCS